MLAACIFSYTVMAYLKKLIGIKSLNTKQCLAGLSPRCCFESYQTAKTLLIFWTRQVPFNRFTSSSIKSVIPSPSNSNFHVITLCKLQFVAAVIPAVSFFLTSGFMYTHFMLILINRCLLNVVFSMSKVLNGQSSPKENFNSLHLSMLFGKPASLNACFPLIHTTTFISNFIKFHSSWDFVACELIKCNGFQISAKKSYEPPYLMPQSKRLKK